MAVGAYEVKKLVRAPIVAARRRQAAQEPPSARNFLELQGYTNAARYLMAVMAIDPAYLHRADLDADSVFVDVGAYGGDGVQQVRDLYGCKAFAFEPNPDAHQQVVDRFAGIDDVVALPYGLGPADATLTLGLGGPGSSLHGMLDRSDTGNSVEVQIRDVVDAFDELGIDRVDLIEINIEGAEYDLLDRMIEAGLLSRIRYLLIQFHEWHPGSHRRRRTIRRTLRQTHDQVWDHPWIFELWCAKSQPHPRPSSSPTRSRPPCSPR